MSRRTSLKSDLNRILNSEASNLSGIRNEIHIHDIVRAAPRRHRQGKQYTIYSGKNSTLTLYLSNHRLKSLIERMVEEFGGSEENTKIWFNSPNQELDGKTPMYFVNQGKFDIIENLIEAIESGQPG